MDKDKLSDKTTAQLQDTIKSLQLLKDIPLQVSFIGETLSDPEAIGFGESAEESPMRQRCADTAAGEMATAQPRALGHARAAIVKKLLTEKSPQPQSSFIRGTVASKSCRIDSNKGDPLQYITDQHKTQVCFLSADVIQRILIN